MKRTPIACVILSLLMISSSGQPGEPQVAQSRCDLTEARTPSVRGVRLGMSLEQLLALFPGSTRRKEMKEALLRANATASEELVYLFFDPATDAGGDRYAGVESVSAGIYKGSVMEFTVSYLGPTWRTIDEWVTRLSESFNLPGVQGWVAGPEESPNKILRCGELEISAAIQGGGGLIRVRNTEYLKGAMERAKAEEERRRRAFKP
jgi:hypothetical protein